MHDDRTGRRLFQRCRVASIVQILTSSGPAGCKEATPANSFFDRGAVLTAALAMAARVCSLPRVKKRASPIEASIKICVPRVAA